MLDASSAPRVARRQDNRGWYFSRANCYAANESITWKGIPYMSQTGVLPVPLPGLILQPAYRRTQSWHYHTHLPDEDHYHESSSDLVWTRRAHAGSFPVPESFPYIRVIVIPPPPSSTILGSYHRPPN